MQIRAAGLDNIVFQPDLFDSPRETAESLDGAEAPGIPEDGLTKSNSDEGGGAGREEALGVLIDLLQKKRDPRKIKNPRSKRAVAILAYEKNQELANVADEDSDALDHFIDMIA